MLPTPNYGVDAPSVMRNFFVFGTLALMLAIFLPHRIPPGPVAISSQTFAWTAGFLLAEGFLFPPISRIVRVAGTCGRAGASNHHGQAKH